MKEEWHSKKIEDIFKHFTSRKEGLKDEEFIRNLEEFGPNRLPQEKPFSSLRLFFEQLKSPLIYFLVIAGIVTIFLKDYTDSAVIFGAVFLNTIIGFFQEKKANNALTEIRKILKVKATVVREGFKKEVFQEEIVPGDIILLKAGDKVPADGRIISSDSLKVNQASLTGEWLPVDKAPGVLEKEIPMAERSNTVYMGTLVEEGSGKIVVIATGLKTGIGEIAQLVRETKEEKTPYQKKLLKFGRIIGIIIVSLSFLIFLFGLLKGQDFIEMFTISVAVAVAAIPEGLPIAMTVVLAIGMQRILKRRGLVRKLSAAESLGSTTVICVDKTGTLTEGRMQVAHILTGTKEFFYDDKKKVDLSANSQDSHILALKIATFCSEAYIENPKDEMHRWVFRGRPTDRALTSAACQAGILLEEIEKNQKIIERLEFESDRKYSATLNENSSKENILFVLGAPEKLLSMSSLVDLDGKQEKISPKKLKELKDKFANLTRKGLRVLATAYKKTSARKIDEGLFSDLNFVGFIAIKDPLRKGVKEVIATAKRAGLRPIIITGDHRLTAKAIAYEVGLPSEDKNIIESSELEKLSDEELKERVKDIEIYARTDPSQKLRIVKAWQDNGEVVAMTGDGINDAPALKKADIGIALGSGTQVAKEISDIVLLDNNFSVIISAIEEGRAIIDNIRKSIVYLISDSFTEIAVIGLSLLFGMPLPVLAAQILWVNLIEDGLPTIALAYEPKEKDLMERKPESQKIGLLNKKMKVLIFIIGLISIIILMGLFYYLLNYTDYDIKHVRSVIFVAMAIITLFYVFSCKSLRRNIWETNLFSNRFLIFAWLIGIIFLLIAVYVPFFQVFLKTVPLNSFDWMLVLLLGISNMILIEFTKWIFISRARKS